MPQRPLPAQDQGLGDRLVFVGPSAFPDRDGFFDGARNTPENLALAGSLLAQGARPHFGWWLKRLGIDRPWPDNMVHAAGLGAEQSGLAWRTLCLRAAGPALTVIGDPGWRGDPARGRPAAARGLLRGLAAVYRHAACSLNITGMLLPSGLTQRPPRRLGRRGGPALRRQPGPGDLSGGTGPGRDLCPGWGSARPVQPPGRGFGGKAGPGPAVARDDPAGHTYGHRAATILPRASALHADGRVDHGIREAAGLDRTLVSAHKGLEVRPENR